MKKFYADIVDPEIDSYISDLYGESNSVLKEMEEYASKNEVPIVGPLVGRALMQLAMIKQPRNILELGSGFGYSAIWFALGSDARIVCTDFAREKADMATGYFKKAGISHKIDFLIGNSLYLLKNAAEKFDIIFNDVDKEYYPRVIEMASEKLNPGGLLISDNVLWYGRVAQDSDLPSTRGVKEYNQKLFSNPEFLSTIIPLRDGVSLSVKI